MPTTIDQRRISLTLYVLVTRVRDLAAEAELFTDLADALAAEAQAARDHLSQSLGDYDDMLVDAGFKSSVPFASLTDEQVVKVANDWDGEVFESSVSPTRIMVAVHEAPALTSDDAGLLTQPPTHH